MSFMSNMNVFRISSKYQSLGRGLIATKLMKYVWIWIKTKFLFEIYKYFIILIFNNQKHLERIWGDIFLSFCKVTPYQDNFYTIAT